MVEDAIISDIEESPEHFDLDAAGIPGKLGLASLRRLIALAGALLLGGVALWATRSGLAHSPTKPVLVSRTAPPPTVAPPLPPLAAAPVVAPADPAVVPAAELPRPEPAAPAEMAEATAHPADELALSGIRPTQASNTRRTARVGSMTPETAPVLAAKTAPATKPVPRSAPLASTTATAKSAPTSPAPASVEDLVREAQRAWMAGQYAAAISKAQTALKARPTYAQAMQAYEIIATSSCALGQSAAAHEATFHLSGAERELVKTMCKASEMTIE
jgi:hypothetical protein